MPGFDRTGPEGQGPQSGRKMGKCNPDNQETTAKTDSEEIFTDSRRRPGRGRGRGLGRGRGNGNGMGRRSRRGSS